MLLSGRCAEARAEDLMTIDVGDFKITVLNEAESTADGSVLLGVTEADRKRYFANGYQTAVNAFLVRGMGQTVVVDTAFGGRLFDQLKALGITEDQVETVLITHMHGDHIGGLLEDGKPTFSKATVYLAQKEADFWRSGANALARQVLSIYKDRLTLFDPEEIGGEKELIPGIRAWAAYGHTPGHTLYQVDSAGKQLLIWGDLTHAMAVQMPRPDVAVTYDTDPVQAVAARKKVLDYVAVHKIPVAGMHVPLPGMGNVEPSTEGGFSFTPFRGEIDPQ
jgi:glyoxylase-like metal-dependent hydrolase (beta-lactamase superfamily II)